VLSSSGAETLHPRRPVDTFCPITTGSSTAKWWFVSLRRDSPSLLTFLRCKDEAKLPEGGLENLQTIVLNNERFSVPEVLFRPDMIGLNQCGVSDAVMVAARRSPLCAFAVPGVLAELIWCCSDHAHIVEPCCGDGWVRQSAWIR
jgi:hypothetical protein